MNLKEIVNRDQSQTYTVEELVYIVQQFILKVKKQSVDINLQKGMPVHDEFFAVEFYNRQVQLLQQAFVVARDHFLGKNILVVNQ